MSDQTNPTRTDANLLRVMVIMLAIVVVAAFVVLMIDSISLRVGYERRLAEAIQAALPALDEEYESALATLVNSLDDAEAELATLGLAQETLANALYDLEQIRGQIENLVRDRIIPELDAGDMLANALGGDG